MCDLSLLRYSLFSLNDLFQFDCCGVDNVTDWGDKVPESCCKEICNASDPKYREKVSHSLIITCDCWLHFIPNLYSLFAGLFGKIEDHVWGKFPNYWDFCHRPLHYWGKLIVELLKIFMKCKHQSAGKAVSVNFSIQNLSIRTVLWDTAKWTSGTGGLLIKSDLRKWNAHFDMQVFIKG